MKTLRLISVPSSHAVSGKGHDGAAVRSQRNVGFMTPSSRTNSYALFSAGSSSSGVPSSRKRTGPMMAMQSGVQENAASTSLSAEVIATWRNAQAVCFDVDSTVCEDEGIDELAAFCGAGEAVAAWTARAMGGAVPFEDALAARLALFQPSAKTLAKFLETKLPRNVIGAGWWPASHILLSKGIRELVSKLQLRGTNVYLVSGGFRQMIAPVASQLNISSDNVFSNTLLFGDNGEFVGFDTTEPPSRSGGKAQAIEQIKKEHGYQTLVMIGDGATDLEARRSGGADMFICYSGIVARPSVVAGADWSVTSLTDLIELLD